MASMNEEYSNWDEWKHTVFEESAVVIKPKHMFSSLVSSLMGNVFPGSKSYKFRYNSLTRTITFKNKADKESAISFVNDKFDDLTFKSLNKRKVRMVLLLPESS